MAQSIVLVQVRLPQKEYENLRNNAAQTGVSMNKFIILALKKFKKSLRKRTIKIT